MFSNIVFPRGMRQCIMTHAMKSLLVVDEVVADDSLVIAGFCIVGLN